MITDIIIIGSGEWRQYYEDGIVEFGVDPPELLSDVFNYLEEHQVELGCQYELNKAWSKCDK